MLWRLKMDLGMAEVTRVKMDLQTLHLWPINLQVLQAQILRFKTGIGFDSQMFDNQMNDKYQTGEGYHAVLPPYTRNFMPLKPDLILTDVDTYVVSKTVTSVLVVATNKSKTSESKSKSISMVKGWLDQYGTILERNMTGNMSYLSKYEEVDGGYVAFGGDPKRELKFNLFSFSQMCNKKNNVLFTNTECVVLSPDFKLLDESQVLLRVPKKNNMYIVDLKNVAPSGDHLGKFDRKADEGLFVGYSMNSKAFRVFNSRTMVVEETLHITFLENKHNVVRSGPTWLFDIDTLRKYMSYKPVVAGNQSNGSVGEEEKKDVKDPGNEDNKVLSIKEPRVNQEKDANVNSTNNNNNVSLTPNAASIKDNVVDENIVYRCADDLNMPNLEEIVYSDDDEDVGAEADMTILDINIPISPIPTTRIHKNHPVEQIIRDIHSASQTKRMTKSVTGHGSRDRPPMLAPGRYPQWCSWFLRYVDTRPNGKALRKCILSGPYKPTTVLVHAVEAIDNSPAVPEHTTEMWEAIERLQHGESLNIQDVKTNLFWEFRKFTSDDGETMESSYTRFYKLMNEMIRNNLTVTTMQQYQNEVNELCAEKISRNANPLALIATAQASQDPFYQSSISHRDKDMQKNLDLIAKYFKKIYKPTNNNLKTSSNSKNKNVDTTPRYKNDDHSRQFKNQRTVNVARAREKVRSQVVQKTGIQCFNCKEYGHFTKECRKPKRVKDSAYHKEKMLLCKQAKQGVPLQAEQYDWLANTDEEVDEQELEAHYSYMAKIQEVPNTDSGTDSEPMKHVQNDAGYNVFANRLQHSKQFESVSNSCLMETDDSNVTLDSPDMCEDDIHYEQNDVESDDECVVLANLIDNLKLDVDENKKIKKQLKKANTTLAQELKECKAILAETSKSLGESISVQDSCLVALQTKQTKFQKEEHDIEKMLSMEKQLKFLNEIVYKRSQSIQTIHMMASKVSTYNGRPTFANPRYLKQAQSKIPCLYAFSYDQNTHAHGLILDEEETLSLERESRSKLNKDTYVESIEKEIDKLKSKKAEFSDMYDVILHDCVSKDVMCSYLQSLSDLDALAELQCMYLHKVKECDCLAQKLLKQTEFVSKKVHTKLLQRFAKLEKHLISLEFALQKCKEQVKNDTVCNENASNVFRKEREQYFEFQDLKAQMQDKNISISELKKLSEQGKGKSMDTKFDRLFVVRQTNAQRIPKPSILGKSTLTPPKMCVAAKYYLRALLHNTTAQDIRERPLKLCF
nr:ribonuclease H-like domain-containing protein [Tanacetum cinerariifolium]